MKNKFTGGCTKATVDFARQNYCGDFNGIDLIAAYHGLKRRHFLLWTESDENLKRRCNVVYLRKFGEAPL